MIRNKKCYILIVMLIGAFIFTGCSTSSKYSMNEEYWNIDKMKTEKKELLEIVDEKGFCIKDQVLIAYIGREKKITIPEKVTRIGENALAGDMYSTTVQEVTVPGTVKKIDARAFAFTAADIIRFEEGVEVIHVVAGSYMENYFKEQMPYGDCSLKMH